MLKKDESMDNELFLLFDRFGCFKCLYTFSMNKIIKKENFSMMFSGRVNDVSQLGSNYFQGVHSDLQISLKRSLNWDDLSIYKSRRKIARFDQSLKSKRCELCHHVAQNQLGALKTKCQDSINFAAKTIQWFSIKIFVIIVLINEV